MNLRSAAFALAFASIATAGLASSPSNDFTLVGQSGKPVGKATYTIEKTKSGYKVHSRFEYRLSSDALPGTDPTKVSGGAGRTAEAQFSFEYNVDDNGNFLSGYTRDSATQTMTSMSPDKARANINISRLQAGVQQGSRTLGLPKPDFLVAPDFDPSSIQILLTTAAAHPHADNTYLLIVPSSPDRGPAANNDADYIILQADTTSPQGTLDGKPITLKHFILHYHVGQADVYTDPDGNLMEADMTPVHATYIRNKFTLTK
ncbi:MAG: hypothetical protein V4555_13995 [Acidobacteriota bacterium]